MKTRILIISMFLATAALACSVGAVNVSTGPTETLTVAEPLPTGQEAVDVSLEMGAGDLTLTGGARGLLEGEVRYNVAAWQPVLTHTDGALTLAQGDAQGLVLNPAAEIVNSWNLQLGAAPMNLAVKAGAYKGTLDLTGVPLAGLTIGDGAGQAEVRFTTANPERLGTLAYTSGLSTVTLSGLAYANFGEMHFSGGAGNYTLDFSGELQRDATVKVSAAGSSVRVIVPAGTAATVTAASAGSAVVTEGVWAHTGDIYSLPGSGPALTIDVDVAAGTLYLANE